MQIETFNKLLKNKHPQATACVPDAYGKGTRKGNSVAVVYTSNGKICEYKGTILAVAEKLGLVPKIDFGAEGLQIARQLNSGDSSVVGHNGCQDTVRHFATRPVVSEPAGVDEFGRGLVRFQFGECEW